MANNQLLASDNFASGSLASGWTAAPSNITSQIVLGSPNAAEPPNTSVSGFQLWTGLTWPNDQCSEVTTTLTNEGGTTTTLFLRVRPGTGGTFSGYQLQISGGHATFYRIDNGVGTSLKDVLGLTYAANDVWSFAVAGCSLTVYQNYKLVSYAIDFGYPTGGSPGFGTTSTVNVTHCKVFAWRGYSAVQQDGVWQKKGIAVAGIAGDFASTGFGIQQPIVILDSNPKILSGASVYKMWFCAGGPTAGESLNYAESNDGISWTRYASNPVNSSFGQGSIVKVGSTYHAYVQPAATPGSGNIAHLTSPDGITWTTINANALALGAGGAWDSNQIYATTSPVIIAGTWYMIYAGYNGSNWASGIATSPDGNTWTKYGSNPVLLNAISGPLVLVNGIWYLWAGTGPAFFDDTRFHSLDLINWTKDTVGIHPSQLYEVAVTNGIPTVVYQIGVAQASVPLASLVLRPEDAALQLGTDNFNRANGGLGANWSTPTGGVALQIVSNKVEATTTSAYNAQYYNASTFGNDQYSEITIGNIQSGSDIILMVRMQSGSFSGYEAQFSTTAATCLITSMTNGATTQIGPVAAVWVPQVGDVIRFSVVGNVLSIYQNGNLILQVQDINNLYTSGSPGFGFFAATLVNATVSNWAGGNAGALTMNSLQIITDLTTAINTALSTTAQAAMQGSGGPIMSVPNTLTTLQSKAIEMKLLLNYLLGGGMLTPAGGSIPTGGIITAASDPTIYNVLVGILNDLN